MIDIQNFRQRFEKLTELYPENDSLKRAFKMFMIFRLTNNIKFLYGACQILADMEAYSVIA